MGGIYENFYFSAFALYLYRQSTDILMINSKLLCFFVFQILYLYVGSMCSCAMTSLCVFIKSLFSACSQITTGPNIKRPFFQPTCDLQLPVFLYSRLFLSSHPPHIICSYKWWEVHLNIRRNMKKKICIYSHRRVT